MTQKYYAIVTSQGAAKIANAAALGNKMNITHMAVGDGGGTLPTPNASQTKLVNEWRRAAINTLSIDPANASQVIAEQVIPENEGGFWIREMGLFDADGTLIAVCNTPETYKPALLEGSGRTQTVRMILIVNSTDAITLKVDPSVVLATRKYVDDSVSNAVIEVHQYADGLMAEHLKDSDPHKQYALKDSPQLTGKPVAPTATAGSTNTQLATTEFVKNAGLQVGNIFTVTAATTLSSSRLGASVVMSGAGGYAVTLPATSNLASGLYGKLMTLISVASGDITISAATSDYITAGNNSTGSFILKPGDRAIICLASANYWHLLAGEASLKYSGSFGYSNALSGYQKLPGGLIIQWGMLTGTTGQLAGAYPVAFPGGVFQAVAQLADKTAGANAGISLFVEAGSISSKTSLTVQPRGSDGSGTTTARYIAIGF